ncbi:MAG TPA: hypothetical protein VG267_16965 [Terracidiphilus sp.]|nr:hypothetical protein [Terracidiphilus sp.]
MFPKPGISRAMWRFIAWGSAIAVGIFILLVIIGNLLPSPPATPATTTAQPVQDNTPQTSNATTAEPTQPKQDNSASTDSSTDAGLYAGYLMECMALKAKGNHYTSINAAPQLISDCQDESKQYFKACFAEAEMTTEGCNSYVVSFADKAINANANQQQ